PSQAISECSAPRRHGVIRDPELIAAVAAGQESGAMVAESAAQSRVAQPSHRGSLETARQSRSRAAEYHVHCRSNSLRARMCRSESAVARRARCSSQAISECAVPRRCVSMRDPELIAALAASRTIVEEVPIACPRLSVVDNERAPPRRVLHRSPTAPVGAGRAKGTTAHAVLSLRTGGTMNLFRALHSVTAAVSLAIGAF